MRKFYFLVSVCLFISLGATAQNLLNRSALAKVGKTPLTSVPLKVAPLDAAALSLAKAAQAGDNDQIITQQPEGTLYHNAIRHAKGYLIEQDGLSYYYEMDGIASDFVVADDGSVYLKNPVIGLFTDSWVKGTKAQGDTVVMNFPQKVYTETVNGQSYDVYADRMVMTTAIGPNGQEMSTYEPDKANREVKFVWRNDTLRQVDSVLVGLTLASGQWLGAGDDVMDVTPMTYTVAAPQHPENKKEYTLDYTSNGIAEQRTLYLVKEDNNVFLGNLLDELPNAWIKGKMDGNKMVFASDQYLGLYEEMFIHVFFNNAKVDKVWNPDFGEYSDVLTLDNSNPLTFSKDDVTGEYTSDGVLGINQGHTISMFANAYQEMRLTPKEDTSVGNVTESTVEHVAYFDVTGRTVKPGFKGVVVKKTTFKDGKQLVEKLTRH